MTMSEASRNQPAIRAMSRRASVRPNAWSVSMSAAVTTAPASTRIWPLAIWTWTGTTASAAAWRASAVSVSL